MADRFWVREGGFVGGVIGFRGTECCWLGAIDVASEPLTDSTPISRSVTFDCEADIVERLDRLGRFLSSEIFVLDLWLDDRGEASLSSLGVLDFIGVSARDVLLDLDLVLSSRFDRRLEEDLLTSEALILIFVFFLGLSASFSSSLTILPFLDSWSRPVRGGLGGAWWFSR